MRQMPRDCMTPPRAVWRSRFAVGWVTRWADLGRIAVHEQAHVLGRRGGQHDSHLTPQEEMADLSDRLFARALCLAALCGRHRLAQVARLDDRRSAVARLPASLDQDLIGLADEPKDDGVARAAAAIDRVDGRFVRWERQEGQHLAEILSKFLAEVLGDPLDVPGDERCTESLGALTNVLFFHRLALEGARIKRRCHLPEATLPRVDGTCFVRSDVEP